jgi:lipid-A-disaccharide synthase
LDHPLRIFISAGEPSGDQHAARLASAILEQEPRAEIRGFGGTALAATGIELDAEIASMAVMGIGAVLPKVYDFWRIAQRARTAFQRGEVDAVVLVDYPGFNWHIAKYAHRAQVPVYYYLPPQLWAWGSWRIKKMRRYVNQVLSVLPFEYQWYQRQGIDVRYIGHPYFDAVAEQRLDPILKWRFRERTEAGERLIGVLPGSRRHEVEQNGPLLLEAVRRIHRLHPQAQFLVAGYREAHCDQLRKEFQTGDEKLPLEFYVGQTSEILECAQCALMVSGSVSLELLARRTPAVVTYRVSRLLHTLGQRLLNISSFTLPNLIAERTLYPEFLSVGDREPAVQGMVETIDRWLSSPLALAQQREELNRVAAKFCVPGASKLAATTILARWQDHRRQRAA